MSTLALPARFAPLPPPEETGHAMLILDLPARIRYCCAAAGRLFRRRADGMIGHPVAALLPDLPLRDNTPGYNLAYVVFHFPSAGWQRLRGSDAAGSHLALDVSIGTMMFEGRRGLVMTLRRASC